MNVLKANSGVTELLEVNRELSGATERLSFTLIDMAGGGDLFDVVRDDRAQYTLLILSHRK